MPRFDAVIFDMDGLMVDTERLYIACNHEIAERYDKQVDPATLQQMMGRTPLESMRIFCQALEIKDDPAQVLADREDRMEARLRHQLVTMPGLYEMLAYANPRYKLAIATGSPLRFLNIVLDQLGIRDFFAALQTSDGLSHGKPHPDIYLRAMAKLGVPGSRCLVLEDSSNGVKAGKAAQAYVIAVPTEHTRPSDLSSADAIVKDLHEARKHLQHLEQDPCYSPMWSQQM